MEDLLKNVRSILNKVTPQTYETLLLQFRSLEINTLEKVECVTNLIMQKAMYEPMYHEVYATLCRDIQAHFVFSDTYSQYERAELGTVLILKCQRQFGRMNIDEVHIEEYEKGISECTDLEMKKNLKCQFEEAERKFRGEHVANCQFIGNLFRFSVIRKEYVLSCIEYLLSEADALKLECLCKLLMVAGKDLEAAEGNVLGSVFQNLEQIANNERLCSRIRFMILDVLELRSNNWISRRKLDVPKTIVQINEEMAQEENEARAYYQNKLLSKKKQKRKEKLLQRRCA